MARKTRTFIKVEGELKYSEIAGISEYNIYIITLLLLWCLHFTRYYWRRPRIQCNRELSLRVRKLRDVLVCVEV